MYLEGCYIVDSGVQFTYDASLQYNQTHATKSSQQCDVDLNLTLSLEEVYQPLMATHEGLQQFKLTFPENPQFWDDMIYKL